MKSLNFKSIFKVRIYGRITPRDIKKKNFIEQSNFWIS